MNETMQALPVPVFLYCDSRKPEAASNGVEGREKPWSLGQRSYAVAAAEQWCSEKLEFFAALLQTRGPGRQAVGGDYLEGLTSSAVTGTAVNGFRIAAIPFVNEAVLSAEPTTACPCDNRAARRQ